MTPAGFRRRRPVQGYSNRSGRGGRRSLLGLARARLEKLWHKKCSNGSSGNFSFRSCQNEAL